MFNNKQYQWVNIIGATTTTVTDAKTLGSVIINAANAGGTITLSDLGSPSVTIGTITLTTSPFVGVDYNVSTASGFKVVTTASPNVTVTYTK